MQFNKKGLTKNYENKKPAKVDRFFIIIKKSYFKLSKLLLTKDVNSSPFNKPCDSFAKSNACFTKADFSVSFSMLKIEVAKSELVFTTKLYISGKFPIPNIPPPPD